MPKKTREKLTRADLLNFSKMQTNFEDLAFPLGFLDKLQVQETFEKFVTRMYRYGRLLQRREAIDDLRTYLMHRDRSLAVLDHDPYQLALQLAMPGVYPRLTGAMRKTLAIKLAYADKRDVAIEDVAGFIKKLPPMKAIKQALGLAFSPNLTTGSIRSARASKKPSRVIPSRRNRKPHPMETSTFAKLRKANRRKNARLKPSYKEE